MAQNWAPRINGREKQLLTKAGGKKPFNERLGGVTEEINNDIMPPGKMKRISGKEGQHTTKVI